MIALIDHKDDPCLVHFPDEQPALLNRHRLAVHNIMNHVTLQPTPSFSVPVQLSIIYLFVFIFYTYYFL